MTAYGLNVRSGPGMVHPVIGVLSQGDVVEVVGKSTAGSFGYVQDKAWLQIIYPIGSENRGWVSATYVDPTGSLWK